MLTSRSEGTRDGTTEGQRRRSWVMGQFAGGGHGSTETWVGNWEGGTGLSRMVEPSVCNQDKRLQATKTVLPTKEELHSGCQRHVDGSVSAATSGEAATKACSSDIILLIHISLL